MERVVGIEPTRAAWKAAVLPLNYTRITRRFYHALWRKHIYIVVSLTLWLFKEAACFSPPSNFCHIIKDQRLEQADMCSCQWIFNCRARDVA